MNIVIAEVTEKEVVAEIQKLGKVTLVPSDLRASLADADVLIVRSATKVNGELLSFGPKLRIVARAGVGLDNVDIEACKKRNIKVLNTPGASSNAVAELVVAMIFAISRKIPKADESMKNKTWLKKEFTGVEVQGKMLGIAGLGRIGTMVALKAKALGMGIIYYDPNHPVSALGKCVSLDELMASSDYISLHMPLIPQTRDLINGAAIAKMKKTAYLINTARGAVVDEEALYLALSEKRIAGAALDVYSVEPYNGKLCELDNVLLTPHIAGSTKEAQQRIGQELVQKLKAELG